MRLIILPLLVFVALVAAQSAGAVTPVNGGDAGGTVTGMNTGPDSQTDPHVSGNLAVYSNTDAAGNSTIHYFDFLTGADRVVPSIPGENDQLSDVNNGRIVFTRQFFDGRFGVVLFDTVTGTLRDLDPQPGSERFSAVIGGTTVSYTDIVAGNADVYAYDLTTGTVTNVSHSAAQDSNSAVSPGGDRILWSSCVTQCDILQSVRVGGTWGSPTVVASTPAANEYNTDTDGTTVVYDSGRASPTGQDVYFQTASGTETALQLPGLQEAPSISNGVIAFESIGDPDPHTDVLVYVIATNTLYRVTNTPTTDEFLSDVTVTSAGAIRVVWTTIDPTGDTNVYGRTFTVPLAAKTPAEMITDLVDKTLRFLNQQPLATQLKSQLQQASSALIANNKPLACTLLNGYIAVVSLAPSTLLSTAQKAELIADARAIKTAIGCP